MIKDIFIDNNITKNFINPMDEEYKKLIQWLNTDNRNNHQENAHLVISKKLLGEYFATASHSESPNNIAAIIDRMTREGRIVSISPNQIKTFKRKYYSKRILRLLKCNAKDRDHIPAVLLSYRKMALSLDINFLNDLFIFSGFSVIAGRRPQDIPYNL
jgi:hypothetical protein